MAKNPWVVHKFGGTSVGSADGIRRVAKIIGDFIKEGKRIAVVVSAMAKVTDRLLDLVSLAENRDSRFEDDLNALFKHHVDTMQDLLPKTTLGEVTGLIENDLREVREILRGVWLLKECSDRTRDFVSGLGELWSTHILAAVLKNQGFPCHRLDARKVLTVEPVRPNVNVLWPETENRLSGYLSSISEEARDEPSLLVITGFLAQTKNGVTTTLGRNGSDFTASIFGYLLNAEKVVIWTDVDGVMSADPNMVPDAVLLHELNYREAIEMAYFGAKVLHPSAMAPAIAKSLPIEIKNSFRPGAPGSVVRCRVPVDPAHPVKGFAVIEPISLVNMEGTGMIGVPGIAARLFDALHDNGISVIMISQASSEHSICFAVPGEQGDAAKEAARQAFTAEFFHGKVQAVEVQKDCAILAVVGEGMAGTVGISARLFSSLGKARVNIRAIAQGSSERNISLVVGARDAARALRAVHAGFYLSRQTISIGIIGAGTVGSALLNQLSRETNRLREELDIDLRVRGILTTRKMVLGEKPIDLSTWRETLDTAFETPGTEAFFNHIRTDAIPHAAIIDCTSSQEIVDRYSELFARGMHIITPNKKACSSPLEKYREIVGKAKSLKRHFLYETTVCAGLPVIKTLHDLVQTGDTVIRIEGMFSGSLSFIFSRVGDGVPFAQALREAMEKGFTEPDPRDDLSGLDVARKTLILAREIGIKIDLTDVPVRSLVSEKYQNLPLEEFKSAIDDFGAEVNERLAPFFADGNLPRYVGVIDPASGARVDLIGVSPKSTFARASGGDNIVSFRTKRYDTNPLIVQGPGAGPEVTAAGVFADILRLCSYIGGEA